jgi:hypothetical protein
LSSSGAGNKPARPSKSANEYTFSAEHVLDKIFEPGTLLGRSLQLLEDDFSIQNLQCIPQAKSWGMSNLQLSRIFPYLPVSSVHPPSKILREDTGKLQI